MAGSPREAAVPTLMMPCVVAAALAERATQPNQRSALATMRFFAWSSATTTPIWRPESGSVTVPAERYLATIAGTRAMKPIEL